MFKSLRNRNYRVWFIGAFVSNIGAWMMATAQNWVVLTQLTDHDATAVGLTMALQFLPQLLLVSLAGSIADKHDKYLVQLSTRILLFVLALTMGLLLITDTATLAHNYVFALILGSINAIDAPSRQAFVGDLVPPAQLPNAVSLNSTSFQTARLIGPAVAGVVIAVIGSGWVFIANGCCFIFTVITLLLLRLPRAERKKKIAAAPAGGLLATLRFIGSRPDLVVVFTIGFLIGTFGLNFPLYASTMTVELGKDATEYGLLSTAIAVGSIAASLLVARQKYPRLRILIIASVGFGAAGMLASAMPTYETFAFALIPVGFSATSILVTANSFVQTTTDKYMRGRVLSVYFAVLAGGTPIGAPFVGWIIDLTGARAGLIVAALSGIASAAVGIIWLITARRLRFKWVPGRGLKTSHIGKPVAGSRPDNQVEALTAPISVLGRGVSDVAHTAAVSLAPDERAVEAATGLIPVQQKTTKTAKGEDDTTAAGTV